MTKSGLARTQGSDDSGAMAAKRIWIARPEPGATRTADRLRDLGFAPLVAPVLVVATSDARPPEGPFAAVLVTSANALGRARDWRHLHQIPVFAVGARTASLARRQGFAAVTIAEGDAASLARLVRSALPDSASLLHAAGEDRKAEPAATLTAAGFRLTTFVAYGAKPVATLPPAVAAAFDGSDALSAMLHYSRRSAATARDLATAAGYGGAFAALRHYCLSADVAVPLAETGITAHFVARQASEDALFAGLGSGF